MKPANMYEHWPAGWNRGCTLTLLNDQQSGVVAAGLTKVAYNRL